MLLACTTSNPPPQIEPPPSAAINHHHHHGNLLSHLNNCTSMAHLKQIHAQALRTTPFHHPNHHLFLHSRLLHYASSADIRYAFRLFAVTQNPNTFFWNTLIRACAHSYDYKCKAFHLYHDMLSVGEVSPDKHTFPFLLKSCAYLFDEFGGKQAHAHAFKFGVSSDVYVNNSLIHFYASCGRIDCARKVFDEMPERSVVSWNAMIDALVGGGEFDAALRLFRQMQEKFEPDGYALQSAVSACAGLGALSSGMWVHAYVLRVCDGEIGNGVLLSNALVEMYCKCGVLDLAKHVFDSMVKRDVNSWNSIILGLATHGFSKLALEHFDEMTQVEGLEPNAITFVGVLSACNHGGMVELGHEYFNKMVDDFSIEPRLEHYGCLVDLLARAGLVHEGLDLVSSMPIKPDVVIWRSLLDACSKQNIDLELSEQVAKKILESEEDTSSGVYALLSRIYASAARWNDVGLIRQLMTDKGVKKEPGCSSLEINGVNHEFFAGDSSHPERRDICRVLDLMYDKLHSVGYRPDLSQAPLLEDEDEEQKKDAARFHRFRDGSCSCFDYW